jgi:hypothetical protein
VVDEVHEARVGPLEVFEEKNGRPMRGNSLEEDPPGSEQDVAATRRRRLEAEQRQERGLHPAAVLGCRHIFGDR